MPRENQLRLVAPLLLCALTAPSFVGCSALPAAGNVLGVDHTQREKKGECLDTGGQSRFLVVDWDSVDRASIEARAARGLVVVRYEGCKMDVLARCNVKGSPHYDYVGLTPKKDNVTMRDSAEVYANIPVYAAKFDAKLAHSGSLDVNMTIVGQLDTARGARRDELEGECDGATHVVSAITVGSFEFTASNANEGSASVTVLGAGAGAKGAQSHEVLNKDGDEAECGKATGDDKKPPFGCGALLRLEVVPIGKARELEPSCPRSTAWNGAQCVAVKADVTCGPGQIPDKERGCVAKKADVTPPPPSNALVAPVAADCTSEAACKERCDASDAKGCLGLGGALRAKLAVGKPSPDGERARDAFQKACDGGEPTACTALGEMEFQGIGIAKDGKGSLPHFDKACDAGDPAGCNDMGLALTQTSAAEAPRAKSYFERACGSTSSLGCLGLGMLYRDGRGVAKDPDKAKSLFKKACDAKIAPACKL